MNEAVEKRTSHWAKLGIVATCLLVLWGAVEFGESRGQTTIDYLNTQLEDEKEFSAQLKQKAAGLFEPQLLLIDTLSAKHHIFYMLGGRVSFRVDTLDNGGYIKGKESGHPVVLGYFSNSTLPKKTVYASITKTLRLRLGEGHEFSVDSAKFYFRVIEGPCENCLIAEAYRLNPIYRPLE